MPSQIPCLLVVFRENKIRTTEKSIINGFYFNYKGVSKVKKTFTIFLSILFAALMFAACSNAQPAVFTKEEGSSAKLTFTFSVVDPNGEKIVDCPIEIVGEGASLMEVMDWYFAENSINFVHDNGLVSTIADLASDAENGWLLYINDAMAEVGAVDCFPASGDKVEWRYVNYAEAFSS